MARMGNEIKQRNRDVTIGEASDLYGKVAFYDMRRRSNGGNETIRCSVKVMGIDPKGNVFVVINGSDKFLVKSMSLRMLMTDVGGD